MYLGTIQGNNNGNGRVTLTADNLKFACAELGIQDDSHTLRRAARAFDLYHSGKVEHVNDHTFVVASQYDRQRPYQVTLHEGATKMYGYCTCQDWMNYSGDMDVPNVDFWCKHMISAALWLHNNGNLTSIKNECGTDEAKAIQAKLNGQIDSRGNNGADKAPSQPQLDLSNPFQQSEQLDIDQIEGRSNGELVHRLSNGEYVISYEGIMKLSEKHDIEFELATHDDTNTIIAKGRRNGSERVSGKPINGSVKTSGELAKRNCARQLLPFAEIKVLELKAKLEADFSWEKAKAKCVELVGTEANVDIIIHELVQAGDLRQDNPSHYNRIEWLIIHNACKKDREQSDDHDGGDNSPPSSEALNPKSLNRWSYNSDAFIEKCREAIEKVQTPTDAFGLRRNGKVVEAEEMPLENGNDKRKLQMDKKLRTWLIEADGTRKAISCREICEKFESEKNPRIVTRLRAGIDSGADISTVELDD